MAPPRPQSSELPSFAARVGRLAGDLLAGYGISGEAAYASPAGEDIGMERLKMLSELRLDANRGLLRHEALSLVARKINVMTPRLERAMDRVNQAAMEQTGSWGNDPLHALAEQLGIDSGKLTTALAHHGFDCRQQNKWTSGQGLAGSYSTVDFTPDETRLYSGVDPGALAYEPPVMGILSRSINRRIADIVSNVGSVTDIYHAPEAEESRPTGVDLKSLPGSRPAWAQAAPQGVINDGQPVGNNVGGNSGGTIARLR